MTARLTVYADDEEQEASVKQRLFQAAASAELWSARAVARVLGRPDPR
jgi:hypothetical protein